ncbi:cysteine hydrolase family protein [Pseudohalocynthiibacter sp. F2068]|jgi:nicotinamidase-related amidase|uniref:cysteine hydrolase family protein n=1 Tax=Pseudohalocynthiibacter sp. F2068 TaxID=2926418 RepID=UPI001FF5CE21|nr:cysteine hydrolase family protein [Pseudohalocynthiibacter sp. F2068]MCK0102939.1 cysteine hydrolase [Pseudohalocynthiibacter sp. F2068]
MTDTLILIDIQVGFDSPVWGKRNNMNAETNAARLLNHWRAQGWPVIHVCHSSETPGSPLAPGQPGHAFKPEVTPLPGETIIEKSVNSAFIRTDLLDRLQKNGAQKLVICGLTTPHCVSTTSRMAANYGFEVVLVEDACAAFSSNADMSWKPGATPLDPQLVHDSAVAHLHGEFVTAWQTVSFLERVS